MTEFVSKYLNFNRTIVSSDSLEMLKTVQATHAIGLESFPSGSEYATWSIPLSWRARRAVLSDGNGTIASLDESPLFLAPYSCAFSGWITKKQLLKHILTSPQLPDAFAYEFRVAYDFRRRLNEWRISIPHNRLLALGEGPFFVEIDVETEQSAMHVGVGSHPGSSGYWFTFLAHYCHVGQANDGLSGVAIMLEVFRRVQRDFPFPKHGYRVLLVPETIGSSVYAATHEDELDNTLGAVFSEMGGAESPLQLVLSRRGNTYIDRVAAYAISEMNLDLGRTVPFRSGWGNDELVYDSPGFGVPTVSLDRYPFREYHTSEDNLGTVSEIRLEEMVQILERIVRIIELDFVPKPVSRVPIYLTRFDLYADWTTERAEYDLRAKVLDRLHDGVSVFDIAVQEQLSFSSVYELVARLESLGLVEAGLVTPAYARICW